VERCVGTDNSVWSGAFGPKYFCVVVGWDQHLSVERCVGPIFDYGVVCWDR